MTEMEFQRQVTDLATIFGWSWAHFRPAQTAKGWRTPVSGPLGKGFPDLILVRERDRRLIFAELKADKGRLTDEQAAVLSALGELEGPDRGPLETQVQVVVWRPVDFDAIERVLR